MSELLKINVNDHTEKKNGLTYLSWAWAWAEVLKVDPKATWTVESCKDGLPCNFFPDGSAMVCVHVTIKGDTKMAVLPVMDNRNKAIKSPDAFAINTAIQRCLAKAIAMHGLGLYIYAGEDLPESDEVEQPKPAPRGRAAVIKPTEGAGQGISNDRKAELDEMALFMVESHQGGDDMAAIKLWYDKNNGLDNEERVYLWEQLRAESKLRASIKANQPTKEAA